MRRVLSGLTALMIGTSAGAAMAKDPAEGLWLTANGKAIVQFQPCGAKVCGKMVWVANPVDESGATKLDLNNPDDDKRARPICGLALLGDLEQARTGVWEDGWIYNPRDGQTYSATIKALAADKLEVRGYLGLSILGKSQIWTRAATDRGGC